MEKSTLIFIAIILFSTCTPILARSYMPCKKNEDCFKLKCPAPYGGPQCIVLGCQCPLTKPLICKDLDDCTEYCRSRGQDVDNCSEGFCYCLIPPM
ncbi:hypothetical protein CARUB_v10006288mg [Capsella rubella]|uniref:Uncharacterized protein n=1 Tax=Capsella rubella TaxID=81985 RepID=R0GZX5_9BRAS|nr:putative defensin-like protein 307 [Capsella rubella]EOA17880.1 hypothetical protein CARUB_v10006288mg [Capsella rubella]